MAGKSESLRGLAAVKVVCSRTRGKRGDQTHSLRCRWIEKVQVQAVPFLSPSRFCPRPVFVRAGAPLGPAEFVESAERKFGRKWRARGRPPKKEAQVEKGTERTTSVSSA
jgi:hypothetical protein